MKIKRKVKGRRISKGTVFINVVFSIVFFFVFFLFLIVPKVHLTGNGVITVNVNSKYQDQGIKIDSFKELKNVKAIDNVDTSRLGTYKVEYIYKDSFFKYYLQRKVRVEDLEAPVITLKGNKKEYYCPNKEYEELGYIAYDNVDGDITELVKVFKNRDKIVYEIKDSSNNKSTVIRKIVAKDQENPTMVLNGDSTIFIPLNGNYEEDGVSVFDNCDNNIEKSLKTISNIDNTKIGDYKITYKVKDSGNNKASITRNIKVRKNLEPNTIYLTFDDGPRDGVTDKILDVLKEKEVKATFFVTNNGSDDLIKRIVSEGHSIGIHTASHRYDVIYSSVDNYFNDLEIVRKRIYNLTGIDTNLIRFPGGSSNTISKKYSEGIMSILVKEVLNKGYQYYDWNVDSGDASFAKDKMKLYNNVINSLSHDKYNVILMHDTKVVTMESLSSIIDYASSNGYRFDVLTAEIMPIGQKLNN